MWILCTIPTQATAQADRLMQVRISRVEFARTPVAGCMRKWEYPLEP